MMALLQKASLFRSGVRTGRLQVNPIVYALVMALITTLLFHGPLWALVAERVPDAPLFPAILWLVVLLLNSLLFLLLSLPRIQQPLLSAMLLIAAVSHYFISHFGTVIDKAMLQNVVETDIKEASGLLNAQLLLTLGGYLVALLVLSRLIHIVYRPLKSYLAQLLLAILVVLVLIGALAATQFSTLAPFFRNYRDVKFYALPISPVSATVSLGQQQLDKMFPPKFTVLGDDVHNSQPNLAPRTIVFVLGETARADHFQLNGYARATNPQLSQLPVLSFQDVSSCGTATAHSVPCMFSNMGRAHYEEKVAKNQSNILDILAKSDVDVLWLDNNSGCKGVCDRVTSRMMFEEPACAAENCTDDVLLDALATQLRATPKRDRVIVLHQLGSHGPEYFKRSTAEQKVFLPECTDKQLNRCARQEVVNAYDNSILATDALLASIIHQLQAVPNSAMWYLSDHGESLGENGVYLHGLPYWMAPAAQTRVPMIMWLSSDLQQSQQLDEQCLATLQSKPWSHDNLFHSLPALLHRQSSVFSPSANLFAACQH